MSRLQRQGAAITGASSLAFMGVGIAFKAESGFFVQNGLGHILTHTAVGGIIADLQGGKFAHGFVSAGITKALSPAFSQIDSSVQVGYVDVVEAMMAALVGGSISAASGGDFANGAITAALAYIYNAAVAEMKANERAEMVRQEVKFISNLSDEELLAYMHQNGGLEVSPSMSMDIAKENAGFVRQQVLADLKTNGIKFLTEHVREKYYQNPDPLMDGIEAPSPKFPVRQKLLKFGLDCLTLYSETSVIGKGSFSANYSCVGYHTCNLSSFGYYE